jgi:choline monooxygenase
LGGRPRGGATPLNLSDLIDEGLAYSLPAAWYHRPEIYERERQAVFGRSWIWLGSTGALAAPGDYIAGDFAGWRVFVIRDRDGALKGFHNVCRHRAAALLPDGSGHCDLLRCPYHGWLYDTAGRLRQTPDFGDAPSFERADFSLVPIRVESWRGLVFVNLDREAAPLTEALGDLAAEVADYPLERYRCQHQVSYEMACNWKAYTDNYVEGYHIPGIHPAFNAVIDFDRFETVARNRIVRMAAPQRDGSVYDGLWLWQYPAMTFAVFPGGMDISRIAPLGPGRTRIDYQFFFADDSPEGEAERLHVVDSICNIVREDFGICEGVQRNLEAGVYKQGPLSPRHEAGVAYFHECIREALGPAG